MTRDQVTCVQFGAGNFLRAFVDLFFQEATDAGIATGRVVVVQSTPGPRAALLNASGGRYHVAIRGIERGSRVDTVRRVESIHEAIQAADGWERVVDVARTSDLRWIISNTTEAGYDLDDRDRPDGGAPRSFPTRLLRLLEARWQAGLPGPTILPCELHPCNAQRLRSIVTALARDWRRPTGLLEYLEEGVRWVNTLVDRIVTGRPASHPLLGTDPLLVATEPFALWSLEDPAADLELFEHPSIERVPDVEPFRLRKVRILNGAHTALVERGRDLPVRTVREAVEHRELGPWLRDLLHEEVLPVLEGRIESGEEFVRTTLERFANPYVEHRLEDIALHHDAKIEVRLAPTLREYVERFGRRPPRLGRLLEGTRHERHEDDEEHE